MTFDPWSEIKPSDIAVGDSGPFTGTFGRVEREHAIGAFIDCLAQTTDTWRPLWMHEVGKVFDAHLLQESLLKQFTWRSVPFVKLEYGQCVEHGYLRVEGADVAHKLALTDLALARLINSEWVRSPSGYGISHSERVIDMAAANDWAKGVLMHNAIDGAARSVIAGGRRR